MSSEEEEEEAAAAAESLNNSVVSSHSSSSSSSLEWNSDESELSFIHPSPINLSDDDDDDSFIRSELDNTFPYLRHPVTWDSVCRRTFSDEILCVSSEEESVDSSVSSSSSSSLLKNDDSSPFSDDDDDDDIDTYCVDNDFFWIKSPPINIISCPMMYPPILRIIECYFEKNTSLICGLRLSYHSRNSSSSSSCYYESKTGDILRNPCHLGTLHLLPNEHVRHIAMIGRNYSLEDLLLLVTTTFDRRVLFGNKALFERHEFDFGGFIRRTLDDDAVFEMMDDVTPSKVLSTADEHDLHVVSFDAGVGRRLHAVDWSRDRFIVGITTERIIDEQQQQQQATISRSSDDEVVVTVVAAVPSLVSLARQRLLSTLRGIARGVEEVGRVKLSNVFYRHVNAVWGRYDEARRLLRDCDEARAVIKLKTTLITNSHAPVGVRRQQQRDIRYLAAESVSLALLEDAKQDFRFKCATVAMTERTREERCIHDTLEKRKLLKNLLQKKRLKILHAMNHVMSIGMESANTALCTVPTCLKMFSLNHVHQNNCRWEEPVRHPYIVQCCMRTLFDQITDRNKKKSRSVK